MARLSIEPGIAAGRDQLGQHSLFRRNFVIVTVIMIAIILHGSLYPYDFHVPPGGPGPWHKLIASWNIPPDSFGDPMANILLYMPLGFFGAMALRLRPVWRILIIGLVGLCLCTTVELTQYFDEGRVTCLSDVYSNTFGAFLGAAAACVLGGHSRVPLVQDLSAQPVPALLLAAMLGYHLFPYVPTIDMHKYWNSLKPIILTPSVAPYPVFHYFALWLTIDYLLVAIVRWKHSAAAIPLFVAFVFVSKIFITDLILTLPEVVGAGLALVLSLVLPHRRRETAFVIACVLGAMVVLQRLEPFTFQPASAGFGWMPFRSFMSGSLEVNTQSFSEKFFLYGSLLWVLGQTGLRLRNATILVALLLFATSYAELYLPDRSAEITDAAMAIVTAVVIAILEGWRRAERTAEPARPVALRARDA